MACGDCKDTDKYRISLKFDKYQKENTEFHEKVKRTLIEYSYPGLNETSIDQIIEFAKICPSSIILENNKEVVMNLADVCFQRDIPIEVKSLKYHK